MRYSNTTPIKILVYSPQGNPQALLAPHFTGELVVDYVNSLSKALAHISDRSPNLFLVHCPADEILSSLDTYQPFFDLPFIPVIAIHEQIPCELGETLLKASFADYISTNNLTQESLSRSFRLLTQAQIKESEIAYLRDSDALTKVNNRSRFGSAMTEKLHRVTQRQHGLALLTIDIDDLKGFNQRMGHSAGDLIIRELCNRLLTCAHKYEVFRLGGDEFALLIETPSQDLIHSATQKVLEKLVLLLHQSFDLFGQENILGTSIGVTYAPDHGMDADTLMVQASHARRRAKRMHGCSFSIFEPERDITSPRQSSLEADLWNALKKEQFELYYQPRIALKTGKIVGAEALIRWHHPRHGLVMPNDFIPIAEHTGQIVPIGFWVIQQAGRDLKQIRSKGFHLEKLGVNLSFRQFQNDYLANTIARIVASESIDTRILEFELTETSLFSDDQHVQHSVEQLCQQGFDFSLDDFGTGYSSFALLQKLPISALKIDRSFVAKLPDSADDIEIIRAVISLAHNLNMCVIAEGVETKAQLEFLIQNDCDQVQGFFFSQPVPLADFMKMLTTGQQDPP
ncbi:putative bifunctional diguanylate cyclase/phosphodiesterase [Neptunomonas concharum]|uniref:cyclic-guanylate-specific phosphodiesterase n=1 Tax=Neptunomonas concharum TaxID=1031538 RepID=A0A5P1R6W8_9GAMM|nr:bifunctional diguanylate cyclase/phosphodiesterase [Neptunomonas concharum]QEQ95424.1 bifunctional diguanylate cyclase/phosphodiesterase [Neptunomonas concharum]